MSATSKESSCDHPQRRESIGSYGTPKYPLIIQCQTLASEAASSYAPFDQVHQSASLDSIGGFGQRISFAIGKDLRLSIIGALKVRLSARRPLLR
jgi:hypothetical protein